MPCIDEVLGSNYKKEGNGETGNLYTEELSEFCFVVQEQQSIYYISPTSSESHRYFKDMYRGWSNGTVGRVVCLAHG